MTPPDKSSILQHRKEGRTAGRFDKARLVRTREMLDADATRFRYPDQPRPDETSPVQPASLVVVVVVLAGESPIDPPLRARRIASVPLGLYMISLLSHAKYRRSRLGHLTNTTSIKWVGWMSAASSIVARTRSEVGKCGKRA